MSENQNRKDVPIKYFGFILPHLPTLLFRSAGSLLRFKRKAKKGAKVFHKELIDQGIDESTASELTTLYLDGSNLFQVFKNLR